MSEVTSTPRSVTVSGPGDYSVWWPAGIIGFVLVTMLLTVSLGALGKHHFRQVQAEADRTSTQPPARVQEPRP